MKRDLLLVSPIHRASQAQLEDEYTVHHLWEATKRDDLLAQLAPRTEILVTTGGAGASRELIERLPKLRLIACFGVGVDAIDLTAARERGIAVTNTPDVLTDDVADLAIGLMLAALRGIAAADRYVRAGLWLRSPMPVQTKVSGKMLGIVGMGRIGQAIAMRAVAFGMSIAWTGPRAKDLPWRYEPDLIALARDVDVLVAACPGGTATRGLISRAVLEALGTDGVFVNIARGSVVDEAALVKLLTTGRLGGAGLDVFIDEPNVPEALFALDNVVLQPHQASATRETRAAMGKLVLDNVAAYVAGQPLITPVK
jgi:lactate dehydrogenase-like 2-hydroxyacid dehydrogenase